MREKQERVLRELIAMIGRGEVTSQEERIRYIREQLGYEIGPANDFYTNIVVPQLAATGQGPVTEAAGTVIGPSRESLLAEQEAMPQFLRGVMGATGRAFGEFAPLAQQALRRASGTFGAQDPIMRAAPTFGEAPVAERGQRFQDFLSGNTPSALGLGQNIAGLLEGLQGADPFQTSEFRSRFPTAESALQAGIQPYISNVAPRQRAAASTNLMDLLQPRVETDPQDYQTTAQIAGILKEMIDKGFIPVR
jgi:hypothetical protein